MERGCFAALLLLFAMLFSTGCGRQEFTQTPMPPALVQPSTLPGDKQPVDTQPEPDGPFAANEAGRVMVLMYHQIGDVEAEWTRTPENLRGDLEGLYREGYRLVSLLDYVNNTINLPRGYSPVVLTFDDASAGQFNLVETGGTVVIDPRSAVGIIKDFAAEHTGFGTAATFYTNYPSPFRQPKYLADKYRMLVDAGMDIGNHTVGHQNLSALPDARVQEVLAGHVAATQKILPGYRVESLALPYGAKPKTPDLAVAGEYNGVRYFHRAVLLVGAHPAPSPVVRAFNPAAIPRIRASDPFIGQWLEYFQRQPEERYVSDGDPGTVTIPETRLPDLDPVRIQGQSFRTYQPDQTK